MDTTIAKVVVGLPVEGPFDYAVDENFRGRIAVGQRVRVSFNRRNRVGFVVGEAAHSAFRQLNPILSLLDEGPVLGRGDVAFAKSLSAYYGCALGEAIEILLPAALRKDRSTLLGPGGIETGEQRAKTLLKPVLIRDETRQRRWPFILGHLREVLKSGQRAVILVPETSFIASAVGHVSGAIDGAVAVLDKKLTPKNELALWEDIRQGKFAVVIGTRSAVFAPVPELGLIVVDEEENDAYKQEQVPHYHAREAALLRAQVTGCRVILAGTLPSAEIWHQAHRGGWDYETFEEPQPAAIQIIDMTNYNPRKSSILSLPLQNTIQKTLSERGTVLLYMNRLGFSSHTQCQQCGYGLKCERCDVYLTYLYSKKSMVCRHCNYKTGLPKICPSCNGAYLKSMGTGIEKLESEAARLYPQARIAHYDRGSTKSPKGADIIIATQAIFRRHDDWSATLVAMLYFDAQMHHVDFRSGHKALSLLLHLRQLAAQKLLVQTRLADNYCLKALRKMDVEKFYRDELKQRRDLGLPPYRHLVAVGIRGTDEESVMAQSQRLYERLVKEKPGAVEVYDPHADINPKLRDKYRYTVLLKGKSVKPVLALIKKTLKGFRKKGVIVTVNVDP